MKTIVIFLALLVPAGMLGCGRQQQPRHIVILPDVSGSIERDSLEQAFKLIDELASQLHRGDRIAIIPILGDAQAEASGRIIRFEVPTNRQAYDSDLINFRATLTKSLEAMQADAAAHPGSKTDILGSIELAAQEFQAAADNSARLLVILSDFIQEDRDFDFRKDSRLKNQTDVQYFALAQVESTRTRLKAIPVYLGLLRSREYGALDLRRRAALQAFWIQYFIVAGAQPHFVFDGLSLIQIPQR